MSENKWLRGLGYFIVRKLVVADLANKTAEGQQICSILSWLLLCVNMNLGMYEAIENAGFNSLTAWG